MSIISPNALMKATLGLPFAINAPNITNAETAKAAIAAAKNDQAPSIISVSPTAIKYLGSAKVAADLVYAYADLYQWPVVLHLDHGDSFDCCKEAIKAGFTSVMFDGSKLPFDENVRQTKEVVDWAHRAGAWVEGELGVLQGVEDEVHAEKSIYTDPKKAAEFVAATGCDSLAVAVGTIHGANKGKKDANGNLIPPRLDIARLAEIAKLCKDTPLVLHGASSVPQDAIATINQYGGAVESAIGIPDEEIIAALPYVAKVNMDTDMRLHTTGSIRKFFCQNPAVYDPRKYLEEAIRRMTACVQERNKLLGSVGFLGPAD